MSYEVKIWKTEIRILLRYHRVKGETEIFRWWKTKTKSLAFIYYLPMHPLIRIFRLSWGATAFPPLPLAIHCSSCDPRSAISHPLLLNGIGSFSCILLDQSVIRMNWLGKLFPFGRWVICGVTAAVAMVVSDDDTGGAMQRIISQISSPQFRIVHIFQSCRVSVYQINGILSLLVHWSNWWWDRTMDNIFMGNVVELRDLLRPSGFSLLFG